MIYLEGESARIMRVEQMPSQAFSRPLKVRMAVRQERTDFDSWVEAALRSTQPPDWLVGDAPYHEFVVSSRARIMRNLRDLPFPHLASAGELEEVRRRVEAAASGLVALDSMSLPERALLVGSRLVAPDFPFGQRGRTLLMDRSRTVSVMVNEEDHLRIQAVTGGLSLETAWTAVAVMESRLASSLSWKTDEGGAYLASSPPNSGAGYRLSVLLHLPGLAASGTAEAEALLLESEGLEIRGVLGERTRAVGAYVQVGTTRRTAGELTEAVRHLMNKERQARIQLLDGRADRAISTAISTVGSSDGLNVAAAVRCLSWLRLGSLLGMVARPQRDLDALMALICFGEADEPTANLRRAHLMRRFLDMKLDWIPTETKMGSKSIRYSD